MFWLSSVLFNSYSSSQVYMHILLPSCKIYTFWRTMIFIINQISQISVTRINCIVQLMGIFLHIHKFPGDLLSKEKDASQFQWAFHAIDQQQQQQKTGIESN